MHRESDEGGSHQAGDEMPLPAILSPQLVYEDPYASREVAKEEGRDLLIRENKALMRVDRA